MSTIATRLTLSFSGTSDSFTAANNQTLTTTTDQVLFNTQIVGTTSETLVLGDLANANGGVLVKNMDATNFVTIDSASTYDKFPQKLLPGAAVFLLPQTTVIHAKANAAPVVVTVCAVAN